MRFHSYVFFPAKDADKNNTGSPSTIHISAYTRLGLYLYNICCMSACITYTLYRRNTIRPWRKRQQVQSAYRELALIYPPHTDL